MFFFRSTVTRQRHTPCGSCPQGPSTTAHFASCGQLRTPARGSCCPHGRQHGERRHQTARKREPQPSPSWVMSAHPDGAASTRTLASRPTCQSVGWCRSSSQSVGHECCGMTRKEGRRGVTRLGHSSGEKGRCSQRVMLCSGANPPMRSRTVRLVVVERKTSARQSVLHVVDNGPLNRVDVCSEGTARCSDPTPVITVGKKCVQDKIARPLPSATYPTTGTRTSGTTACRFCRRQDQL